MDPGRNPGSEGSGEECKRDEVSVSNLSTDPINPTEAVGKQTAKTDAFVRSVLLDRADEAGGGAAVRAIRVCERLALTPQSTARAPQRRGGARPLRVGS